MNIITTSEELDNYIFRRLAGADDASLDDEDVVIGTSAAKENGTELDEDNTPIIFTLRDLNTVLDNEIERILTNGFEMDKGVAVKEDGSPDVVVGLLLELEARHNLPLYNIQNLVCTNVVNLTGTYLLIYS